MTKKKMIAILSAIGVLVVALVVVLIVSLTGNKKAPSVPEDSSTEPVSVQTDPVNVFDPRTLKREGEVYVIGNDGVYTVYTCDGNDVVNADIYIDCGTYEEAESMCKIYRQLIELKQEGATYARVTVRDCYFVGTMKPEDLASTGLDKKALEMLAETMEQIENQQAQ